MERLTVRSMKPAAGSRPITASTGAAGELGGVGMLRSDVPKKPICNSGYSVLKYAKVFLR